MADTSKKAAPNKGRKGPLRWSDLPHAELWRQANHSMDMESPARAGSDSLRSILEHRLPLMDRQDHRRYVEVECARIVETLRVVRDTYRKYLLPKISGPVAEMYWVVFRFGVKDWAVMRLRSAAAAYIAACKLPQTEWDEIFKRHVPMLSKFWTGRGEVSVNQSERIISLATATKDMESLLPSDALERVGPGGPFGRDYQGYLAPSSPTFAMMAGEEEFADVLKRRLAAWDNSGPWTEGLATLFDVTQAEILTQAAALSTDGHKAEAAMVDLSEVEKIAYRHLSKTHPEVANQHPEATWRGLLEELDRNGISPSDILTGTAKKALLSLQKGGKQIATWVDCFYSVRPVSLSDGKKTTLRRVTTRALHNAAKRATYRLSKVWTQAD